MKRWFIKLSKAGVILLVLTLAIGTIYETTSRKQASQNFPLPGKLIDVGDRRINLDNPTPPPAVSPEFHTINTFLARTNLGLKYENGEGVTKSKSKAISWYRKSVASHTAD